MVHRFWEKFYFSQLSEHRGHTHTDVRTYFMNLNLTQTLNILEIIYGMIVFTNLISKL